MNKRSSKITRWRLNARMKVEEERKLKITQKIKEKKKLQIEQISILATIIIMRIQV